MMVGVNDAPALEEADMAQDKYPVLKSPWCCRYVNTTDDNFCPVWYAVEEGKKCSAKIY